MCVTCFPLWFCTSTLCTVLTTNHLLMGFSEHLSVVSDRRCHPSPVKKTSNEASGRVGILFFFSFSHVCVCVVCMCIYAYFAHVWAHMYGCTCTWVCTHVKAHVWCQASSSITLPHYLSRQVSQSNPELDSMARVISQPASEILNYQNERSAAIPTHCLCGFHIRPLLLMLAQQAI